jgi:F-type H+-transporting ATPase subunit b
MRNMNDSLVRRFGVLVSALLIPAARALAAEAEGGGHESTPSLFSGDFGNAFWTLLIFVVLLIVLGKWAWGPVLATLQKREQFIRESLDQAKRDREQAEKRLQELEARLRSANEQAAAIVEEGRRDAEAARRRIHDQAQTEAEAMIARAKREIGIARDTAVRELYQVVADMATDVAAKALRRSLTDEDQKRLIEASLDEIRSQVGPTGAN